MLAFFTNVGLMEFQVIYLALFLLFSVIGGFKWFWMGSLHKNVWLMLEFLKGPFLVLLYINDLPGDVFCNIANYADDIILFALNVMRHLICMWQQLELASEFESDLQDTVDYGRKWLVDFNAGKTQLVLPDQSNNTGAIDVKMDGSVLEEKPSFKMLGLNFSLKLDLSFYITSIAKITSKKIAALIRSMKILSPEVVLCTIRSCMENVCHVWAGAPSCYLELLDKLQKWISRTAGPSLAASLEPLAHR